MKLKEAKEITGWIYTRYPLHKVLEAIKKVRPKLVELMMEENVE